MLRVNEFDEGARLCCSVLSTTQTARKGTICVRNLFALEYVRARRIQEDFGGPFLRARAYTL